MTESALLRRSLEWFATNRIRARRNNTGAIKIDGRWIEYGGKGEGDIIGNTPYGRYFEAEAKTEAGRQRPAQKKHQVIIEKGLGLYVLFRSIEDLEAHRDVLVGAPEAVAAYCRLISERCIGQQPRLAADRLDL